MAEIFEDDEIRRLMNNSELRALAIGDIYDNAVADNDVITKARIAATYPARYLDQILGTEAERFEEELDS